MLEYAAVSSPNIRNKQIELCAEHPVCSVLMSMFNNHQQMSFTPVWGHESWAGFPLSILQFILYLSRGGLFMWCICLTCLHVFFFPFSPAVTRGGQNGSINAHFFLVCNPRFECKQRSSQVFGTLRCSSASMSNTLHFDWAFCGSIATIAW